MYCSINSIINKFGCVGLELNQQKVYSIINGGGKYGIRRDVRSSRSLEGGVSGRRRSLDGDVVKGDKSVNTNDATDSHDRGCKNISGEN